MMKPLPTTSQDYSIILHEESQREVHSENQVTTVTNKSSIFNVNTQKWNVQKTNNENKGGNQNSINEPRRSNMFCSFCKKPRHQRGKCYKLIGYPQSLKFTKPKRNYGSAQVNAVAIEESEGSRSGVISGGALPSLMNSQGFTKEQCEQLINMIQFVQGGGSNASGSDANASANFVGKCYAFYTFISCFTAFSTSKCWIIDSDASQYMTHDKTLLNNFKELSVPIQVTLPNSYRVKVTSLGSVALSPDLEL